MNMHSLSLLFLLSLAYGTAFGAAPKDSLPPDGSLLIHAADPSQGFVFSVEQARGRFFPDFVRWGQNDIGTLPRQKATLVIGSSSIRGWRTLEEDLAPREVIPRGFGGSRMVDVMLMLDFFLRYEAAEIIVYQGDNDLAGENTDVERDFLAHCRNFVAEVQAALPETRVYFISIKPSPARLNATDRFREANRRLAELCAEDPRLVFIDVFSGMLDASGEPVDELYASDRLHLSKAGYAHWGREVSAILEEATPVSR